MHLSLQGVFAGKKEWIMWDLQTEASKIPMYLGQKAKHCLLEGSWDLVTRVILKVTLLITTYNPNQVFELFPADSPEALEQRGGMTTTGDLPKENLAAPQLSLGGSLL